MVLASASQLPHPAAQEIEQAPKAQLGVPWLLLQACPQPPQFPGVVLVLISQPLTGLPSQLPYPELHVVSWQVPEAHVSEALARSQGVPHVPQLVVVLSGASQPLLGLPSQS